MKSLILRRVPMKMIRIGTLFLAGTFPLTGTSVLRADTMTLEGTVSDTKCMAQHSMKDCYELVVGSAVYTLKASAKDNMEIEKARQQDGQDHGRPHWRHRGGQVRGGGHDAEKVASEAFPKQGVWTLNHILHTPSHRSLFVLPSNDL